RPHPSGPGATFRARRHHYALGFPAPRARVTGPRRGVVMRSGSTRTTVPGGTDAVTDALAIPNAPSLYDTIARRLRLGQNLEQIAETMDLTRDELVAVVLSDAFAKACDRVAREDRLYTAEQILVAHGPQASLALVQALHEGDLKMKLQAAGM